MAIKVAVMDLLPSIVIVVGLVLPVRFPDQLPKVYPAAGTAVTVTTVPDEYGPVVGFKVTEPLLVGDTDTPSV
jgi:hypothetical protein